MNEVAQSFGVLNYSGLLYNTSDAKTPLVNSLPRKKTTSVKFAIESRYALGTPSQPAISETASLTAPDVNVVTRDQRYNVTQIFQKATGVSYAKLSNTGTLSGINVAGQESNVMNELDFQVGVKMAEIRNDLEYTLINGSYNEAANDAEANQTRGLDEAISTNVVDAAGEEFTGEMLVDVMQKMYDNNADTTGLILMVNPTGKRQITAAYPKENGFILPATRTVGGVAIDEILTDFGTVGVMIHNRIPAGKMLLINPSVLAIVEQDVPGKGNFFWEELARTGAGITGDIFGQAGLDHGPEWFHGKIENLKTPAVSA